MQLVYKVRQISGEMQGILQRFSHGVWIGAEIQLDLFETVNIRLECPYGLNQKNWKPTFIPFAKARKRVETLFSQLTDRLFVIRELRKENLRSFCPNSGQNQCDDRIAMHQLH